MNSIAPVFDKAEALKIDENKGADNYDRYDAITKEVEESDMVWWHFVILVH